MKLGCVRKAQALHRNIPESLSVVKLIDGITLPAKRSLLSR
jgi:hypothetical protein